MKYKAKILGHKEFITGTLESSSKDGFNDMIRDKNDNVEYIDVTTITYYNKNNYWSYVGVFISMLGIIIILIIAIILNFFKIL
jgi:hypothetical protein